MMKSISIAVVLGIIVGSIIFLLTMNVTYDKVKDMPIVKPQAIKQEYKP